MHKRSERIILFVVLALAALLRFLGTSPGFPPVHEDEGITHSQGMAMILEKTLDPKYGYGLPYNYPIVVPFMNAVFYLLFFIPVYIAAYFLLHLSDVMLLPSMITSGTFEEFFKQNILGTNQINVVFWGRYVTALFGVGVSYMGYLLGKRLFRSAAVGLIAAFFIAINYRQVLNSHIGILDIYNAFFLLLALYWIVVLWQNPTRRNYILSALFAAIFFSTKFQLFVLPPLFLVCIYLLLKKQKNTLFLFLVLIIATVGLNTFHLLNLSQTIDQVGYSALKYAYGRNSLNFYTFSYLYYYGIGPITSIAVLLGIMLSLLKSFDKSVFLLSVIIPFLWMMAYYTDGGFYTRNFITIIPLLLVFGAFGLYQLSSFLKNISRFVSLGLLFMAIVAISYQSLQNSLQVPLEYIGDWNFKIVRSFIIKNIPKDATILSHSDMALPTRLNLVEASGSADYFLAEAQGKGADWIILNTGWLVSDFYWWMRQDTATSLRFWQKPVTILTNTPLAKMVEELKSYVVFEVLNAWQAPDFNYLVVKVPKPLSFKGGKVIYRENFNSPNEWLILNDGFGGMENFSWDAATGAGSVGSLKISSLGGGLYSQRFVSPRIPIRGGKTYAIIGKMLDSVKREQKERDGLLGVNFLTRQDEVVKVAISSRLYGSDNWSAKEVVAVSPEDAEYAQIFFQRTRADKSTIWLDDVEVTESTTSFPEEGAEYINSRFKLEEHLFQNSNSGM